MKKIRSILRHVSLSLCIGFLTFIALEGILAEKPVGNNLDKALNHLVFQAGHQGLNSVFARQSSGSELAVSDTESKSNFRYLAISAIVLNSQSLSTVILTTQHQLPPSAVTGSRTLLYRRLII